MGGPLYLQRTLPSLRLAPTFCLPRRAASFSTTRVLKDRKKDATEQQQPYHHVTSEDDFAHHRPGVARLNHASFGAVPAPVLAAQERYRKSWLEQPDEWYFTGKLHESIRCAAASAATTLVLPNKNNDNTLAPEHVCLVENATVAACAVAYRWSHMIRPHDVVLYLNVAYQACIHVLKEYCESKGATLVPLVIPFLATSKQETLTSIRQQLVDLVDNNNKQYRGKKRIRFAFLDHVSSQPAVLLPLKEMIELIREYGYSNDDASDMEVCVDGAHAVGSVPDLDVTALNCDFYFSNLHKWGFAPPSATVFWSKKLPEMQHPIVSWAWGQGMTEESLYTGTRDYSAFLTVPAAGDYLRTWRRQHGGPPFDNRSSQEYCHDMVIKTAATLRRDWGVDHLPWNGAMDDCLIATQAMVRLPDELIVTDKPGQVSRGVREVLRHDFNIEASVGHFQRFGHDKGSYLRLSWAVYNTEDEIQRLSNAVIKIIGNQ